MIRFVHTADIHFGMENYGRPDPVSGIHSRLLDFEKALNFCVDHAIKEEVDFFLFAGDAYKTATPSPTHQRMLMNCFLKLYTAKIPIVMVVGNHDHPLSFGKTNALEIFGQIPIDGFHVMHKPEILSLKTKNGPINIVGIPWPTRNTVTLNQTAHMSALELTQYISSGVSKIIQNYAAQLDSDIPAVLCGHLTVSTGIFSGSEKRAIYGTDPVFLPSQLAIEPFDYVALGHLHRYQDLNAHGYPSVIYSGSVERIDFGERKEEKGFCVVSIPEKGKATHTFIKTPARPFIQIEVHLDDSLNHTEQILQELAQYPIADAVIKIIYHVPAGKKDRTDLLAIQRACSAAWYIVGIIPIHIPDTRQRRSKLDIQMDMPSLLSHYFETKPEYKDKKQKLLEKVLLMKSELFQEET